MKDEVEATLNPQFNTERKKKIKANRKKATKFTENYDFATDFFGQDDNIHLNDV